MNKWYALSNLVLVYGRVVTEIYRDALSNLVLVYGRVVTEIYRDALSNLVLSSEFK
jgi:hypothetical protein